MTVPGGVTNLPAAALTIDNLASTLQDTTPDAMKARAVARFPGIMDNSTGLSPASDLTPFGILTRIWAEVNSRIANADPADIQGPEDLPDLVIDFIESLPVVGELVGLLEAILGTYDGDDQVLLSIQRVFDNLRALLGGDFTSLNFDPVAGIKTFIQTVLKPTGLLVGINDILGAPVDTGFPYALPHGFEGEAPTDLSRFFANLKTFLGALDFTNPDFDLAAAATHFITEILHPQNLLAELVGGKLPNIQAPPIVQQIIDGIANLLPGIPIIGSPLSAAIAVLTSILNIGQGAQAGATTANTEISILKANQAAGGVTGGKSLSDTFEGAQAATLNPAKWAQFYTGPGAGTLGIDGQGNSVWAVSGSGARSCVALFIADSLTGDTQQATWTYPDQIAAPFAAGDPYYRYVLLRCDGSSTVAPTNYIYVRTGYNDVQLGYVVAGVQTAVSTQPFYPSYGDSWEWKAGDSSDIRHHILKLNGNPIITATESGSVVGASNRRVAIRNDAGGSSFGQVAPGQFGVVAAADRAAAA